MQKVKLINELKATEELLVKAIKALEYSYNKVKNIELNDSYHYDELEVLESFTSRFSRLSDIFTQKYLKTVFILLGENNPTLIDMSNQLNKYIGINADDLMSIRYLKNELVHEYKIVELNELYQQTIDLCSNLISTVNKTIDFANAKLKIQ